MALLTPQQILRKWGGPASKIWWKCLFLLLFSGSWSWAETTGGASSSNSAPPAGGQRSALEDSIAKEALAHFGWKAEPHPEGKEIESIDVYILPVFDARDPIPTFFNIFHSKSRDWIIRQETLVNPGELYDVGKVKETERNLRSLRQLSVANVIAAKGSAPDKTRLIVVVKDVWSLRINSDFGFGGDGLEYLLLNPAEENLAGLHLDLGLLYLLERDRYSLGTRVVYPRMAGSRWWVGFDTSVSFNRDTNAYEGSSGSLSILYPLYSRYSPWGTGTQLAWRVETTRRYRGSDIRLYEFQDADGAEERIPEVYRTEILAANYYLTRSWGVLHKRDLTFGFEISSREYRPIGLAEFSPQAQAAFIRDVLPVSDTRLSPFAQLRVYRTRFLRTLDLEILGLQEDYRMGYDVLTRVSAASRGTGSTRDQLSIDSGLLYSVPLGNGFARLMAQSSITVANQNQNQALFWTRARVVSPLTVAGRLHFDALVAFRYWNYLNASPFSLGGNDRLRGYGFDEFQGENLVASNLEFRTRSIDILSAQVGLATFVDAGATPNNFSALNLAYGVGFGGRILFPHAERSVLRVDWGFPVGGDRRAWPGVVYVSFGQAFGMPNLAISNATSGVSLF
ncbi:MAG: hypothetical protein MK135_04020 [Polyangiaceae bacterium]|nr:hypothetical protein [Polyangiaceae bacterium]